MFYEIAHFRYTGATVCILIHRLLSAPMRKSSHSHSCTYDYEYDQNHKSLSTSSTSLSHFYWRDADLSASIGLA